MCDYSKDSPIWETTEMVATFFKKKSGNWQLYVDTKEGAHGGMFNPEKVLNDMAEMWGLKIKVLQEDS